VTAGRRRRVVMIAVAVVSIAMVGPVLLSEVSTAAMASTRASVVSSTTRPVRRVVKRRRHATIVKRKRSVRKVVTSTTTTATSSSTTSTTSTTVAGRTVRFEGPPGRRPPARCGHGDRNPPSECSSLGYHALDGHPGPAGHRVGDPVWRRSRARRRRRVVDAIASPQVRRISVIAVTRSGHRSWRCHRARGSVG
jgi:hypothetical protein